MEEIDLKELFDIFLKRKILIILVVIIFALLGAIYTLRFVTPTYQSTTRLVLVQTGTEANLDNTNSISAAELTLNSDLIVTYSDIATSRNVLLQVIENLNLDMTIDELEKLITVSTETNSTLINISIVYEDAELACSIAEELANDFIVTVNSIYKLDNLYILDFPIVATTPSNINVTKNVVIFAFVGLILVSGYVLLINMLDTTVKNDTDIEKAINVPVLASIVLASPDPGKTNSNEIVQDDFVSSVNNDEEEKNPEESELTEKNYNIFENYNENNVEKIIDAAISEQNDKTKNYNKNKKKKRRK